MRHRFALIFAFSFGLSLLALSQAPKPAPPLPIETQQQKQAPAPDAAYIHLRAAEENSRPALPPKASLDNLVVNSRVKKITPKTPYDSKEGQTQGRKLLHEIDQANAFARKAQMQLDELVARQNATKKLFDAWAEKVCKDNGWNPKEYRYDISSDTWYQVAPKVAK